MTASRAGLPCSIRTRRAAPSRRSRAFSAGRAESGRSRRFAARRESPAPRPSAAAVAASALLGSAAEAEGEPVSEDGADSTPAPLKDAALAPLAAAKECRRASAGG
jgi:hypothetical protein